MENPRKLSFPVDVKFRIEKEEEEEEEEEKIKRERKEREQGGKNPLKTPSWGEEEEEEEEEEEVGWEGGEVGVEQKEKQGRSGGSR